MPGTSTICSSSGRAAATRCRPSSRPAASKRSSTIPIPIPRQPAMAGVNPHDCPEAARACDEVLSLPLHPGLTDDEAAGVVTALKGHYACVRS